MQLSHRHARPLARRALRACAVTSLIALIALTLLWETWLAPLRAGGSWMAVKSVPLFMALPGIFRGRTYTFRWAMLLVLAYFAEGTVRAYAEAGTTAVLATNEIALSLLFFTSAIAYVRIVRPAGAGG
jgi:uncharacterized membrane protein